MNFKQKLKTIYWFIVLSILLWPFSVSAVGPEGSSPDSYKLENPLVGINSIDDLLIWIVHLVQRVFILIAGLMFMWGGFKYITAQGDTNKIEEATDILKWTAIGTAILLATELIIRVISATIKSIQG